MACTQAYYFQPIDRHKLVQHPPSYQPIDFAHLASSKSTRINLDTPPTPILLPSFLNRPFTAIRMTRRLNDIYSRPILSYQYTPSYIFHAIGLEIFPRRLTLFALFSSTLSLPHPCITFSPSGLPSPTPVFPSHIFLSPYLTPFTATPTKPYPPTLHDSLESMAAHLDRHRLQLLPVQK
jgi:hypothetical protein